MSTTFLQGVTRIMRIEGIIRGDTDAPTTFSDLQHGATIQLAQIAIQDELNQLISDTLIPAERESAGVLSSLAGTRSYSLPSDFIRMFGIGILRDATNSNPLYEYPGGEERVQNVYWDYKTAQSNPIAWYFDATSTKKIALWPVPSVTKNYTFDYEKSVAVSSASDTLPFQNDQESHTFLRMAGRRFKFLYQEKDLATLDQDPERALAKVALVQLILGKNPPRQYANVYG